jgi:hypothetical protein
MEMRFVNVDEHNLATNHRLVEFQQADYKGHSLFRIPFAQEFLALLPAQTGDTKNLVQQRPGRQTPDLGQHPTTQLLQRPSTSGQVMILRVGGLDGCDDLFELLGCKKGACPPVRL